MIWIICSYLDINDIERTRMVAKMWNWALTQRIKCSFCRNHLNVRRLDKKISWKTEIICVNCNPHFIYCNVCKTPAPLKEYGSSLAWCYKGHLTIKCQYCKKPTQITQWTKDLTPVLAAEDWGSAHWIDVESSDQIHQTNDKPAYITKCLNPHCSKHYQKGYIYYDF